MAKALTATGIESLQKKAKATGKRQTASDSRTPGLYVRVTPAGGVTFYAMSVGPKDGTIKQVWAAIRDGNAPVTTLAKARELAPQGVANIKNGKEAYPRLEVPTQEDTYPKVAERFIRQYARPRQRTWKETARILGLRLEGEEFKPIKGGLADPKRWGKRQFADISSTDADKYISEILEAGKDGAARVALSWLKTCWRWAWRRKLVDGPVMDSLLAEDFGIVSKARDRVYTDAEIKALWNAQGDKLTSRERAFLKLSVLLGVRAGALSKMRKSELDSTEAPTLWTVPTEHTKTRKSQEHKGRVYLIPISPLARRVLLPLLKGEGDLVFPSATHKSVPMDCGTPLSKKVREASGVGDWYQHAHRDTIATWLQNQGHDKYDRALVLQHAGAGTVTDDYSHGYSLERARGLLEKWSDHVASVAAPKGAELLA
jgi:integrase